MKREFTTALTKSEIAFKRTVRPTSGLQTATLAASLRTGKRYGVAVGGGAHNVVLTAYRLNAKGEPTGLAEVIGVQCGLTEAEAVTVMESL